MSIFLGLIITQSSAASKISGQVMNGLRILTQEEVNSGHISLHRGDYVVFPTNGVERKTLQIPELKISHTFPAKERKKNYVKFKKAGEFKFRYQGAEGTVHVIEYEQANYQAVDAAEAKNIITNISPLLLDVRTPAEYEKYGFIDGAMLLPVQSIQRDYTKLNDYIDKPILIYCATGNRSTVAAKILIDKGFKNIFNMRYGVAEWQKKGYPLKKSPSFRK